MLATFLPPWCTGCASTAGRVRWVLLVSITDQRQSYSYFILSSPSCVLVVSEFWRRVCHQPSFSMIRKRTKLAASADIYSLAEQALRSHIEFVRFVRRNIIIQTNFPSSTRDWENTNITVRCAGFVQILPGFRIFFLDTPSLSSFYDNFFLVLGWGLVQR